MFSKSMLPKELLEQAMLVKQILDAVNNCLEVDEIISAEEGETTYSDGGRFILSLSEKQKKALEQIISDYPLKA